MRACIGHSFARRARAGAGCESFADSTVFAFVFWVAGTSVGCEDGWSYGSSEFGVGEWVAWGMEREGLVYLVQYRWSRRKGCGCLWIGWVGEVWVVPRSCPVPRCHWGAGIVAQLCCAQDRRNRSGSRNNRVSTQQAESE
jgi:hypothetical protein